MHKEIDLIINPSFVQSYQNGYLLISNESLMDWSKVSEEGTVVYLLDGSKKFIAKGYYGKQNKGFGLIGCNKEATLTKMIGIHLQELHFPSN